jgi:outer membrane protein, heavy metal efflux system
MEVKIRDPSGGALVVPMDFMQRRPRLSAHGRRSRVRRGGPAATLLRRGGRPAAIVAALLLTGLLVGSGRTSAQGSPAGVRIDLDAAIRLALQHNHALNATRTLVPKSRDQEITASLRPNPVFLTDGLYIPFFSPSSLNSSVLNNISEFDVGVSYTIERGHKRQARVRAARDQTAVTVT